MSMTAYARDDRPVREPEDPRRAAMARRTLTRWAVRLALREWKQRILIVALIALASAATLLGIAVASATPGTPNAGTFGTASTLVTLPGNTPSLPSVIAKIQKAYGPASVVDDEPIALGGWLWYYPHLETATAHRTAPFNLPWAAVIIGLLLAVATSVIAAVWPGRAVSKIPVVAALSGRIDPPQLVSRSLRPGLIFLAAGLFVLYFSGGQGAGQGAGFLVIAGMLSCEIASALLAPFIVDRLSRLAWRGPLWVATPALLKAFGISPSQVNPAADVLTVRGLLPSTGNLVLVSGSHLSQLPNIPCPAGTCIQNPVIQKVSKLPAGTAVPNTVITEGAVKALHETIVGVGWLIQAPSGLTPVQVNAARQAAVGLGTTIESKSGQLSLGEISNGATIGGLLLALGVLAMTIGLIRSETVGDLRTLTAAGAGVTTRRALTGVTACVIAFLGAALGAAGGCLAVLAWARGDLTTTFSNVPWSDIGVLVIGMPLIGGAAAWLLSGRQPSAVSRQPLE